MKKLLAGFIAFLLVFVNIGQTIESTNVFLKADDEVAETSKENDKPIKEEKSESDAEKEEEKKNQRELADEEYNKELDKHFEKSEKEEAQTQPLAIITIRAPLPVVVQAGESRTVDQIIADAHLDLSVIPGATKNLSVDISSIRFGVPGDYLATGSVTGILGTQLAKVEITVRIIDTLPPLITGKLNLSYPVNHAVTESQFLIDAGIQVTDNALATVSPTVDLSGVNFANEGIYTALVHAQDASGNSSLPFVVSVTIGDIIPPVITGLPIASYLSGITRTEAEFLADQHVVVTDNSGEAITPTVDLSGVDFTKIGVYTVNVHAKDSAGNQAIPFPITINIIPLPKDLITANLNLTYEAGHHPNLVEFLADSGIKILSIVGLDETPLIDLSTVDFDTVGDYPVVATARTLLGVPLLSITLTVHVVDHTAPTITGNTNVSYPVGANVTPDDFIAKANIQMADNATGILTPTVDLSGVNFNLAGDYTATVTARDASGNISTPFSVKVTVGDKIPPVITGETAVSYVRGISRSAAEIIADANIIVTDNSGEAITPTFDLSSVNFNQVGVYPVQIHAQDSAGNQATVFTLNIMITAVPNGIINAKADVTYEAGHTPTLTEFIADAGIGLLSIIGLDKTPVVDLTAVDFNTVGVYPVVASAVSILGVTLATVTINVHIVDHTAPVITANPNITYEVGSDIHPIQFLLDVLARVTDNTDESIAPTVDLTTVNFNQVGTYTAIIKAVDGSGNQAIPVSVSVSIEDKTPPVITGDAFVNYMLGTTVDATKFLADAHIVITDNSRETITPIVDLSKVDFNKPGTYQAVITATDSAGNTTSINIPVNIIDNVIPVITIGNSNLQYEVGTVLSAQQLITDGAITVTDNSGEAIVPTIDLSTVKTDTVGTYTSVVRAIDSSGNAAISLLTITIVDNVAPIITGNDTMDYQLGAVVTPEQFLIDANIVVTDNSGLTIIPTVDLSRVNFNTPGNYIATVSATDNGGNTTTFSVAITVTDTLPPVISIKNPTLEYEIGTSLTGSRIITDAGIVVTDNSGLTIVPTVDLSTVNINVVGKYAVVITAEDFMGNIDKETITVNIVDKTAPVITGNTAVTYEISKVAVDVTQFLKDANIVVTDNSGATITPTVDLSGVIFNTPGTYNAIVSASDPSGNSSQFTVKVTIVGDNTPPVITGDDHVGYKLGAVISAAQFLLDAHISVTDNSGEIIRPTVDLSGVNFTLKGSYTAVIRAVDSSGNIATFNVTVNIGDTTPPQITGSATMTYIRGVVRSMNEYMKDANIIVTDDSGELITPIIDLSGVDFNTVGTYQVSATASDSSGNIASPVTFNINIVEVPSDLIRGLATVSYEAGATLTNDAFISNAAIRILNNTNTTGVSRTPVFDLSNVNMKTVGTYPVSVSAVSTQGVILKTITVNIEVYDFTAPTISAASAIRYEAGTNVTPEQFLIAVRASVTDNTNEIIAPTVDLSSVNFNKPGTYTANIKAVDSSGNQAMPMAVTVTIVDTTEPIITGNTVMQYGLGDVVSAAQFLLDAKIEVIDNTGEIITPTVDLSGVDFNKMGTYIVNVIATDSSNNTVRFPIEVRITDTIPPVITGNSEVSYPRGAVVTAEQLLADANIQITDNSGELVVPVVYLDTVDFNKAGIYEVIISAQDSSGNMQTFTVKVVVGDVIAPIITGDANVTYLKGVTRTPDGFVQDAHIVVTDNSGETITAVADLSHVNFNLIGTYPVPVRATDSTGNIAIPFNSQITIVDIPDDLITADPEAIFEAGSTITPEQFIADAKVSMRQFYGIQPIPVINLDKIDFTTVGTYAATASAVTFDGATLDVVNVLVHIIDTTAPLITGDAIINYELGTIVSTDKFLADAHVQVTDNASAPVSVSVDFSNVNFLKEGSYKVVITATDGVGIPATFDVTVNITADKTPPIITWNNQPIKYEAGQMPTPDQFIQDAGIVVTDNSGENIIPTVDFSGVDFNKPGTYPVIVSATDSAGNTTTLPLEITIEDTTKPVIHIVNNAVDYELGTILTPEQLIKDAGITITDNSGEIIVPVIDFSGVDVGTEGTYSATISATDTSGNTESAVITIHITQDITAPVILGGDKPVGYEAGATVTPEDFLRDAGIVVTDNSGENIIPDVDLSGVYFNTPGTYPVTVTAKDAAGNTSTKVVNVIIGDKTPPVITGNANVSYELGSVITPNQFLLDANIAVTDNSGLPIVPVVDLSPVNFFQVGTYTVSVSATDLSGNVGTFSVSVNITPDKTPPVITASDIPMYYEAGDIVTPEQFLKDMDVVVTDNSGENIIPTVDLSGVDFYTPGVYPVIVIAKDSAGNTAQLPMDFIVVDVTAPVITGNANISYELGSIITPDQFLRDANIKVTDNSGENIAPVFDLSNVNFGKVGSYVVKVSATDVSGNTGSFDVTVTITPDVTKPVISAAVDQLTYELGDVITPEKLLVDAGITVTDNSGLPIIPVADLSGIDFNTPGTYKALITATDLAGNTATFELPIIIADTTAPVISAVNNAVSYELGTAVRPEKLLADAGVSVTDNSGLPITPIVDLSGVNFLQVGTYTATISATDASGNTATLPITVNITADVTKPVITGGDNPINYEAGSIVTPEQFLQNAGIVVTDNSGESITPTVDLSGVDFNTAGTYPVSVSATDSAGNTATKVVNIVITDTTDPVITGKTSVSYELGSVITPEQLLTDANIVVTDNSGATITPVVDLSGVNFGKVGAYAAIITATDASGNKAQFSVIVNITPDVTKPIINTGVDHLLYELGDVVTPEKLLADAGITATDNSGLPIVPIADLSGIDFTKPGTYKALITATDLAGNTATLELPVEIMDTTAPVITGNANVSYELGSIVTPEKLLADAAIKVTDNSGLPIVPVVDLSGVDFGKVGTYTATISATDQSNNTSSFSVTVTITGDKTPPVITGTDLPIYYEAGDIVTPEQFLKDAEIVVTDNSGETITPTVDLSGVDFNTPGVYPVTVSAMDSAGNIGTLPMEITIVDTTGPVISAVTNPVSYELGSIVTPEKLFADAGITVTDNSGAAITPVVDLSSVDFGKVGTYTATIKATDPSGNGVTFALTVLVTPDVTKPVISAANDTLTYGVGEVVTPEKLLADAGITVTDNSGLPIVPTVDLSGVDFSKPGTYTATVNATDAAGNTASLPITITIADTTPPVIIGLSPISYEVGSIVTPEQVIADAHITVTDDSGLPIVPTVDLTTVDFTKVGSYTAMVSATDLAGNTATLPVVINVKDTTPPVVSGENALTYNLGTALTQEQVIADANIAITDNSGLPITPVIDISDVDVNTLGDYPIILTATDASGNVTIWPMTITIADTAAPVITGKSDLTYRLGTVLTPNQVLADANIAITDNSGEVITPVVDLSGVNVDVPGTYTATVSATDSSGNTATFPIQITISNEVAPILKINIEHPELTYEVKTALTNAMVAADGGITVTYNPDFTMTSSLDISGVNPNVLGTYTAVVTADDSYGNHVTADVTIHIVDTTKPVITALPGVVYLLGSQITPDRFIRDAATVVTDNYDTNIIPVVDLSGVNFNVADEYTATISATDSSGNVADPIQVAVKVIDVKASVQLPDLFYEAGTVLTADKVLADAGATASLDGVSIDPLIDLSRVNARMVGEYTATVLAGGFQADDDQFVKVPIAIHIYDTTAPTIGASLASLSYPLGYDITEGDIIKDSGITVQDNTDEVITPTVQGFDNIVPTLAGIYPVNVSATDSSGNTAANLPLTITVGVPGSGQTPGPGQGGGSGNGHLPGTGDNTAFYQYFLASILIVGSTIILVRRKRKTDKNVK